MHQKLIFIATLLCTSLTHATQSYQVDLILFANQLTHKDKVPIATSPMPLKNTGLMLKPIANHSTKPYQILPLSQSGLKNEYYLLCRSPHYKVLAQYSWIQPANSKTPITIPSINKEGWQIQGAITVIQNNYYTLNADLYVSMPNSSDLAFKLTQHQRLKGNTVYYIDHPQIGILIKAHTLDDSSSSRG